MFIETPVNDAPFGPCAGRGVFLKGPDYTF